MGKKHNTLNDTIFRNSKYIEVVNTQVGCKDFKKEYEEQYSFMLDTFRTIILLNNCFYSDSNLSLADKVAKALDIMEAYIYIDTDKKKYSVRFIQGIIEKHSTHLYRRINEWYITLEHLTTKDISTTNYVKNVMEEIEEEMSRLENVGFDNMVKDTIEYKKNKVNNYKIYISKFDDIYNSRESFLRTYKADFNELYGIILDDDKLQDISLIFSLVAKANNGIINVLSNNILKDYNLSERSYPQDFYNAYLDSLNIDIKDNFFRLNAEWFMFNAIMIYANTCVHRGITLNEMMNNFDIYYFFAIMKDMVNDNNLTIKNDLINKVVSDLKQVYEILNQKTKSIDELLDNFKSGYVIIQKIIDRNNDYFIRVS